MVLMIHCWIMLVHSLLLFHDENIQEFDARWDRSSTINVKKFHPNLGKSVLIENT